MSYLPKDSAVQQQSLQVASLALPFTVTHNASSASVVVTVENPSLLFINTQGTSRITLAAGAVDSAQELTDITFASPSDTAGTFNMLVRINETVNKVVNATLYSRTSSSVLVNATLASPSFNSANSSNLPAQLGVTDPGNKIALNCTCGVNFSTTDFDGVLVVNYEPHE